MSLPILKLKYPLSIKSGCLSRVQNLHLLRPNHVILAESGAESNHTTCHDARYQIRQTQYNECLSSNNDMLIVSNHYAEPRIMSDMDRAGVSGYKINNLTQLYLLHSCHFKIDSSIAFYSNLRSAFCCIIILRLIVSTSGTNLVTNI